MRDLNKVNATQLFSFWKNFSLGLLVMMATLMLSWILPFYFSPIVGLLAAAFLYTVLYNNRISASSTCVVIPYAMFYCVIAYAFSSIALNVLDIWNFITIPKELSFFNYPYISALILDPVCFLVLLLFHIRGNRLAICIDCKTAKGLSLERGKLGEIISSESKLQLANMIWMFGILSAVVWAYYFFWYYKYAIVNGKDWYVFLWINVAFILIDEVYFASRYFNIYIDLKDSGEIIYEDELSDMTTKTNLRYYLVCGDKIFLDRKVLDRSIEGRFMIDTPFVTKRNVDGITTAEALEIIQRMTGVKGGELRFFFGREMELSKHRILRYFYFLDGDVGIYDNLDVDGDWVDFDEIKTIYSREPETMSRLLLIDLLRLVTVVLTQKLFDENGIRRLKLRSYQPPVSLSDVRENNYDFQDDKWIRISMYNSDSTGFQWRMWIMRLFRYGKNPGVSQHNSGGRCQSNQ